ncbi:hypothetical protein [Halorussus salinus]|uniref:hypothetical protein n=1 Tax=Halorussus salinus TaxID=1364935 RepID=UPI00138F6C68|nr:hypothetical protein [Halorussus salinus]
MTRDRERSTRFEPYESHARNVLLWFFLVTLALVTTDALRARTVWYRAPADHDTTSQR